MRIVQVHRFDTDNGIAYVFEGPDGTFTAHKYCFSSMVPQRLPVVEFFDFPQSRSERASKRPAALKREPSVRIRAHGVLEFEGYWVTHHHWYANELQPWIAVQIESNLEPVFGVFGENDKGQWHEGYPVKYIEVTPGVIRYVDKDLLAQSRFDVMYNYVTGEPARTAPFVVTDTRH